MTPLRSAALHLEHHVIGQADADGASVPWNNLTEVRQHTFLWIEGYYNLVAHNAQTKHTKAIKPDWKIQYGRYGRTSVKRST